MKPEALAPTIAKKTVLDPRTLRRVLRQLAEGVSHLHRAGKLHRDLKPANVLVTPEGRVVILDFGLVTEMAGERTTDANIIQGTVAYMSPEQARGDRVQQPADWYVVGVMLYQALTGTLPYGGSPMAVLMAKQNVDPPPPWEIEPEVPRDLATLCSCWPVMPQIGQAARRCC